MDKKYLHAGPITNTVVVQQLDVLGVETQTGAQISFFGRVRADQIDNKQVIAIVYSAYEDMVEGEFQAIEKEFLKSYPDLSSISIVHGIGEIKVGEIAMSISICGGHRKQALIAIGEIIDVIKHRVPIWKKELFADGNYAWTENAQ